MTKGEIIYRFKCDELELKLLEIPLESESIPSVTMETVDKGIIKATFKTHKIYNIVEARIQTDQLVEKIADRLSFFLNVPVKKPVFLGCSLPSEPNEKNNGRHRSHCTSTLTFDAIVCAVIKPGAKKREEIIDFLKKPNMTTDLLISEFAFSISQHDDLSKFMLLYNLILQICGDKQKLVDDKIKQIDPTITIVKTKRKTSKKLVEETIFTKLRNEIAHNRDGATKQDTIKGIKHILPKFLEIIRKAIKDQIS